MLHSSLGAHFSAFSSRDGCRGGPDCWDRQEVDGYDRCVALLPSAVAHIPCVFSRATTMCSPRPIVAYGQVAFPQPAFFFSFCVCPRPTTVHTLDWLPGGKQSGEAALVLLWQRICTPTHAWLFRFLHNQSSSPLTPSRRVRLPQPLGRLQRFDPAHPHRRAHLRHPFAHKYVLHACWGYTAALALSAVMRSEGMAGEQVRT